MDKRLQSFSDDKSFWFSNGSCAHSVSELRDVLLSIDDNTFNHHVNQDKNDISKWLEHVVEDKLLATKLTYDIPKEDFVVAITDRIEQIEEDERFQDAYFSNHIKSIVINQIKKYLGEINSMITNNFDIIEKYERIRVLYKKLDKNDKETIYPEISRTYSTLQKSLSDINNLTK